MNFSLPIACAKTIEALYANDIAANVVDRASDTQALVEKMADGKFAILFPGTASARDWLTDLEVRKVQWGGGSFGAGRVHRGFVKAYDSVRAGLVHLLPPGVSLVIAGHSLGGALATLCAEDLAGDYPVADVITFGSPRVGNGAFARHYNAILADRTVRLVNAGDPVPHVPWLLGTYRHVHTQHYLDRVGGLVVAAAWSVAVTEAMDNFSTLRSEPASALDFAREHGIGHYRKKLEALQ